MIRKEYNSDVSILYFRMYISITSIKLHLMILMILISTQSSAMWEAALLVGHEKGSFQIDRLMRAEIRTKNATRLYGGDGAGPRGKICVIGVCAWRGSRSQDLHGETSSRNPTSLELTGRLSFLTLREVQKYSLRSYGPVFEGISTFPEIKELGTRKNIYLMLFCSIQSTRPKYVFKETVYIQIDIKWYR